MWQAPFTHRAILQAPLVVALPVRALHVIWMLASNEGCAVKPRRPASPTLQREVWMVSKCCMEAAAYLGVEIKKGMWFGGDGEWVADAWWSWDPVNGICEICLCPLRMPVEFLWICYVELCFLSSFLPMGYDFCIYTLLFVETCAFEGHEDWNNSNFPKEARLYPFTYGLWKKTKPCCAFSSFP